MVLVYLFTAVLVLAQLLLPRRLAFIPLLVALFHLGNVALISEFTPMRIVILIGLGRAFAGGFLRWSAHNRLDQLVAVFAVVALLSSLGHTASVHVPSPLIERCGLVLNVLGAYLYARAFTGGEDFVMTLAYWLAIVMIPLSAMLTLEQVTGRNAYAMLGSRSEGASMRNDGFRAKGPFGHAITAGTATAVTLPFMIFLWRRKKVLGTLGALAAVGGALATASSGPLAALAVVIGLLVFWRWRQHLRPVRLAGFALLVVMHFTMSRPIWYLIARIDLVGGSTGWHRSSLIDRAIRNLDEWWLAGTDVTRHWMHSGVTWNPNHTDITNYYLQLGVLGGLPLLLTLVAIIAVALMCLEASLPLLRGHAPDEEFASWCVWTAILAHSVSFLSIAYFDQSYAGFFLLVGAAPGLLEAARRRADAADADDDAPVRSGKWKMRSEDPGDEARAVFGQ
jgi:hypothetical protein